MAAVDMFLKLDGIKGESGDHKHKDEIHIESFSWGMNQSGAHGAGGGGGAGKVSVHDISITKHVDKSTPALMLACCNGKHIASGLITVRKAGEKPLEDMKIKLVDILVSGVQEAGHGGATLEDLALMRKHAPPHVQVKAAGGVRDLDTLIKVRALGVSRCGASRTKEMLDECRRRLGLPTIQMASTGSAQGY